MQEFLFPLISFDANFPKEKVLEIALSSFG